MRLIDADALKEVIFSKTNGMEDLWDTAGVLNAINSAPIVELTEEQAIDKLHETGWLSRHDKEMTERPQGEWIRADDFITFGTYMKCSNCNGNAEWLDGGGQFLSNYCPICGAKMKGGAE